MNTSGEVKVSVSVDARRENERMEEEVKADGLWRRWETFLERSENFLFLRWIIFSAMAFHLSGLQTKLECDDLGETSERENLQLTLANDQNWDSFRSRRNPIREETTMGEHNYYHTLETMLSIPKMNETRDKCLWAFKRSVFELNFGFFTELLNYHKSFLFIWILQTNSFTANLPQTQSASR